MVKVYLFWSMDIIFDDGWCYVAMAIWGLNTATFRLSTTVSSTSTEAFPSSGDGVSARFRLLLVYVVVASGENINLLFLNSMYYEWLKIYCRIFSEKSFSAVY
jgi:hypothetical protein